MNKGLKVLFELVGDKLRHIKKLDLSSNYITGLEGGQIIASSNAFPNLFSLDLRINKLGDEGFKALIQSKNYPKLTAIKIDRNKLEDTGAEQLVKICNIE